MDEAMSRGYVMKIEIGRFTLFSDAQCMWITEEKPKKKKEAHTDEFATNRVAGYSMNFEQLLTSFIENGYRSSDAKDVKKLLSDMAQKEKDIIEIAKKYAEGK